MTVRMAVPNKGRLNERTIQLMTKAGIDLGSDWGRRLEVIKILISAGELQKLH